MNFIQKKYTNKKKIVIYVIHSQLGEPINVFLHYPQAYDNNYEAI